MHIDYQFYTNARGQYTSHINKQSIDIRYTMSRKCIKKQIVL